ncbi:MAG TPA: hypothetical protein VHH73_19505 [Verrucomicrobiae bacterium]|nr:hypothetical protein [Verrucomicrobiae bacterium]
MNLPSETTHLEWLQTGALALLVDRAAPMTIEEIAATLSQPVDSVRVYCDLLWAEGMIEACNFLTDLPADDSVKFVATKRGQAAALAYFLPPFTPLFSGAQAELRA